jgi:hypothetical protein
MTSLFSAIRSAVRSGTADHVLDHAEGEPGATALNPETPHHEATTEGGNMSGNQTVAGAAQAATAITAAVAAASGGADGFKTATERMQAILGADGIKGDGKRMAAALDLATASPDMAADAVVAFVTANVPASTTTASSEPAAAAAATAPAATQPKPAAGAYEASVQAAASLAMPGGSSAQASGSQINRDAIFAARRIAPKGV